MLDKAQLRRYPTLAASALPEAQKTHGSIIWSQLSTLGTLLLRLQHALQVLDYCAEEIAATRLIGYAARRQHDPMAHRTPAPRGGRPGYARHLDGNLPTTA